MSYRFLRALPGSFEHSEPVDQECCVLECPGVQVEIAWDVNVCCMCHLQILEDIWPGVSPSALLFPPIRLTGVALVLSGGSLSQGS